MPEASHNQIERSRKARARVLQALARPGSQADLARVLGRSESDISRIKNSNLDGVLELIYGLGFKVVSADKVSVKRDALDFMREAVGKALLDKDMAERLFGDEE